MQTIAWLLLAAALLPIFATVIAKAGGKQFDNGNPRVWLNGQEGYRARANAAQNNFFEGLPIFFAAVLFALHNQIDLALLRNLMLIWLVLRLGYLGCYLANLSMVRSVVWALTMAINITILMITV